jgi:hypothetical protein
MAAERKTKKGKEATPEQVTEEESLKRVKSFPKRKENLIAAVKKSKN